MDINIDNLTKNLAEYSREANNASISISKGLLPIGLIVLAIFFLIELMNWKHFLNRHEKKISASLWIEFSVKYLIGFVLLMIGGYILDSIMEISIIITKKVAAIYPPSSYVSAYKEVDYDAGWIINAIMGFFGWLIDKITTIIVYILIFMRYIDLYLLKAIAPIIIGFYYSDEFRPIVMNFFKTFIAYCLLGVVLLIITVVFSMVITDDALKGIANNDTVWTGVLIIVKGIVYLILITGSVSRTKRLVGA